MYYRDIKECGVCNVQDVGAKNEEGNTPLHFACLNGHVDIVKMLMLHGASPSELNWYASLYCVQKRKR